MNTTARQIAFTITEEQCRSLPTDRFLRKVALYQFLSAVGIPASMGPKVVLSGTFTAMPNPMGGVDVTWTEAPDEQT